MTAVWQARLSSSASQLSASLAAASGYLARDDRLRLLQRGLIALLCLWLIASILRALWSFFPETEPVPAMDVINPTPRAVQAADNAEVDIDALVATQLFGEPGAQAPDAAQLAEVDEPPAPLSEAEALTALAGIEDGAPETRLPLLLRGVVASSEAGLGQAVIEHRNEQDLYQVGDELPVRDGVVLAKVLPDRVVLDNGGRFELLRLFEDSTLSRQVSDDRLRAPAAEQAATEAARVVVEERSGAPDEDVAALAAEYRQRLYSDPQSLADVVRVSAVREGTELIGYRVSPGTAAAEFRALGFEPGDIVTGVNGLSLTDPSNTVRLYQAMRSAQAASFELQRKGESVSLYVDISQGAAAN